VITRVLFDSLIPNSSDTQNYNRNSSDKPLWIKHTS
jgi:hypothetical protein